MSDEPTPRTKKLAARTEAHRPPPRLLHAARVSLRATVVYASALSDRFELGCTSQPAELDGIPPDLLVHLEAVAEAFQDGARRTLWFIEPELARSAQTIASLAREGAGDLPAEGRS